MGARDSSEMGSVMEGKGKHKSSNGINARLIPDFSDKEETNNGQVDGSTDLCL